MINIMTGYDIRHRRRTFVDVGVVQERLLRRCNIVNDFVRFLRGFL